MEIYKQIKEDINRVILHDALYSAEWRSLIKGINIKYNLKNGGIPEDLDKIISFDIYLSTKLENYKNYKTND